VEVPVTVDNNVAAILYQTMKQMLAAMGLPELAQKHQIAYLVAHYQQGAGVNVHTDQDFGAKSQFILSMSVGGSAKMNLFGKGQSSLSIELHQGDCLLFDLATPHSVGGCEGERWNFTCRFLDPENPVLSG